MRVPALTMTNPLMGRATRGDHELIERRDEYSSIFVRIDSIKIAHDGDEHQFRPFVRIRGQLESISPSYRLPGAVSGVSFTDETGPSVDVRYDFSMQQMIAMIEKGFFEEGFDFVDGVRGETLELNAPVDYKISRAYDENGLDTPIVFYDIPDRTNLHVDEETSGYDFVEYMDLPDKSIENYIDRELDSEFGVNKDIFEEMHAQFEQELSPEKVYDVAVEPQATNEFEAARQRVQQYEAENAPEPERHLSEADRLYEDAVAPGVESEIPTADKVSEPMLQVPDFEDDNVRGSSSGRGMDLGSLNLGSLHQSVPTQQRDVDEDWLFENKSAEDHEPQAQAQHGDEEHQVETEQPQIATPIYDLTDGDVDAGEKSEADASKARMAAMLAEHARQAEIAEAAHELGVRTKDITPNS